MFRYSSPQVCCTSDPDMFCGADTIYWQIAPILEVNGAEVVVSIPCPSSFITGVRYAYREAPCPNLEQCAIYSVDGSWYSFPAPPFTYEGFIP